MPVDEDDEFFEETVFASFDRFNFCFEENIFYIFEKLPQPPPGLQNSPFVQEFKFMTWNSAALFSQNTVMAAKRLRFLKQMLIGNQIISVQETHDDLNTRSTVEFNDCKDTDFFFQPRP